MYLLSFYIYILRRKRDWEINQSAFNILPGLFCLSFIFVIIFKIEIYLTWKQKQTLKYREQTSDYQRESGLGGMDEIGEGDQEYSETYIDGVGCEQWFINQSQVNNMETNPHKAFNREDIIQGIIYRCQTARKTNSK